LEKIGRETRKKKKAIKWVTVRWYCVNHTGNEENAARFYSIHTLDLERADGKGLKSGGEREKNSAKNLQRRKGKTGPGGKPAGTRVEVKKNT